MQKLACLTFVMFLVSMLASCASPSSIPSPTSTPALEMIKPGDKIGEMTIVSESIFTHKMLVEFCEFDLQSTAQTKSVDCTVTPLDSVGLGMGLSAEESKFLSFWEATIWELEIDGYPVALNDFGWDEVKFSDPGMKGISRGWSVVIQNLTPGKHTIHWSNSADITTEDVFGVYPPGKYEYIINLAVENKSYPPISADTSTGQHAYTSSKAKLDFLLYLPGDYGKDPARKWPLLVYLHGAHLNGANPDLIRSEPLPSKLETEASFPFIVLSPQGKGEIDLWSKDELIEPVMALLDEIQTLFSVDSEYIYLIGDGVGGNGVWAIGLRYPGTFAALVPIGGYYGYPFTVPENICDLKDVPIWAFHGGKDAMVPVEAEQILVDALNACGGNAQITVKPDATINIRYEAYANPELYDWFLSHSHK